MSLFASTSRYVFPLPVQAAVRQSCRRAASSSTAYSANQPVPYTLHAQCSSNNTVLTLYVDSEYSTQWGGQNSSDAKPDAGRKVFSISCGMEGFKKAQRGTFEAATNTVLSCFKRMEGLLDVPRPGFSTAPVVRRKKSDAPYLDSLTISMNGFGQGRDAIYSVLTMAESYQIRRHIRALVDKTPIKIGGSRPKKRRVL